MPKKKASRPSKKKSPKSSSKRPIARCGLCGSTKNLVKTECCGNWTCDDEHEYVMFSFAHNSCSRNHNRYTLCGYHFNEEHPGDWKDCPKCREAFDTEIYVYYGTNKYNFEVLPNPPAYEPTKCTDCGKVIDLGAGGYSYGAGGYRCGRCTDKSMRDVR